MTNLLATEELLDNAAAMPIDGIIPPVRPRLVCSWMCDPETSELVSIWSAEPADGTAPSDAA